MGTAWSNDDDGSFSSFSSDEEEGTTKGREQQQQQQQLPAPPEGNSGRGTQQSVRSSQRARKPPIKLQQYVVAGKKMATVPQGGPNKKKPGTSRSIKKRAKSVVEQDTTILASEDGDHVPPKKVQHQPAAANGAHKKRALTSGGSKGPAKKARGATKASVPVQLEEKEAEDGTRLVYATYWLKKYQELVAFHGHHGHCRVPQNTKYNASLSGWSLRQRKRKQDQKLSAGEIHKLDQLGFEWTMKKQPSFEDKCQELEAFRRKFNHCNVPSSGKYASLGRWLYSVKRRYKGKYSTANKLNQNQIDRLESIGIDWTFQEHIGRARGPSKEDKNVDEDDECIVDL